MLVRTLFALLLLATHVCAEDYHGDDPYDPKADHYQTKLLIVGGSSSGTAAAITAGRMGVDAIWTLRAPRDMGGLSTNAINPDTDLPVRHIGGLAFEYDVVARYTTGFNVGGRPGSGEGYFSPLHVFFNYTRQQIDALPTLKVLSNLYPLAVEKDPATKRVSRVIFGHRLQPQRRIVIEPQVTIDAEIEGDVAFLAGVEMTLLREGRVPSDDPTRNNESYAGRLFTPAKQLGGISLIAAGGKMLPQSTFAADTKPATMAWNGSVALQDFGNGTAESPWVLKNAPAGFDPKEFEWWDGQIMGVRLGDSHWRWNIDRYLSAVEGWRLPDGRHALESMNIADREANEKAHLAPVLRALWHLQHTKGKYQYGLSKLTFREGLRAKYMLSDFGIAANEGDEPMPGLIYMREGRRLVNDHVFGGKLIEDDGSGRFAQKRHWHHRAAYFNAMLVDIHGVHRETVPGSGPEGMQLLRLAGFHNFGVPCIPFDVFVPRASEATGLLLSSAGAYTHQAYAAFPRMETARIAQGHACAIAAILSLKDDKPVHEIDVRKVQFVNLQTHNQSIVYLEDTLPGTSHHVVDQMLGARRVPERNDSNVFQRESHLTVNEARVYLERLFRDYAETPAPNERLAKALDAVGSPSDQPAARGNLLMALSLAAGIEPQKTAQAPYADVAVDRPLAPVLSTWIKRGWLVEGPTEQFHAEQPMPFGEFKQHAFNICFSDLVSNSARPVDFRPRIVHDAFNRAAGTLGKLESGQVGQSARPWEIAAGNLRCTPGADTSYLFVDTKAADFEISADVFLEQTKDPAAAGLVVRARNDKNMHRFLLDTDGPDVRIRIDTLADGQRGHELIKVIKTLKRGFTLRVNARGDSLEYLVDGEQVHKQSTNQLATETKAGLLSGGNTASRFDNFEIVDSAANPR